MVPFDLKNYLLRRAADVSSVSANKTRISHEDKKTIIIAVILFVTSALCLFNIHIGAATPVTGTLARVDWGTGAKFIQVDMDATGGTCYTIGLWPELGGYVFWVSADGKHGLVAEIQNQGITDWHLSQDLISNPANHSSIGIKFRDWRMPTKYELNEMYLRKDAIGDFATYLFWSSSGCGNFFAWSQTFANGDQICNLHSDHIHVRAVRDF